MLVPHSPRALQVALVNNMPDLVLEQTEAQFANLLNGASEQLPVCLNLFTLPHISRGEQAQRRISEAYAPLEHLWNGRFDGVIVTGTEPRHADLREEAYWPFLAEVLDWAAENTSSAILSCLAAHAGVLHSDGIPRQPLHEKRFGVFSCRKVTDHAITRGTPDTYSVPHSRWNEVTAECLLSSGYQVLSRSPEVGADSFAKQQKESLFVYFQGHPEYSANTIFEEYRRDIRRFMKGTRPTYPSMPEGYFDHAAEVLFSDFRERATSSSEKRIVEEIPCGTSTQAHWAPNAQRIYRNWLRFIAAKRSANRSSKLAMAVDHA
jgi:homoserine O-succinyltransferase